MTETPRTGKANSHSQSRRSSSSKRTSFSRPAGTTLHEVPSFDLTPEKPSPQANGDGGSGGVGSPTKPLPVHKCLHATQRLTSHIRRWRQSEMEGPMSYLHCDYSGEFSVQNEIDSFIYNCRQFWNSVEDDRLPWRSDFMDPKKLSFPSKKDIKPRLNLNLPYYASNYIELNYMLCMPMLLILNPAFFFVAALACLAMHSIAIRKKCTDAYGGEFAFLGRVIPYKVLGHVMVVTLIILLLFFNGFRSLGHIILFNCCTVVPHALLRNVTYFDDEELEKCRPKLFQYLLILVFLLLSYIEGASEYNIEEESARMVARERKRLELALDQWYDDNT